jgi:hypothetical protein
MVPNFVSTSKKINLSTLRRRKSSRNTLDSIHTPFSSQEVEDEEKVDEEKAKIEEVDDEEEKKEKRPRRSRRKKSPTRSSGLFGLVTRQISLQKSTPPSTRA